MRQCLLGVVLFAVDVGELRQRVHHSPAMVLLFGETQRFLREVKRAPVVAGWRIEREFLVQDELAVKLEAAASDQQRDEILEKENRSD